MGKVETLRKALDIAQDALNVKLNSYTFDENGSFKGFQDHCEPESSVVEKLSREYRFIKPFELEAHRGIGDLMTIEEFADCCHSGGFIDYDGSGNYATEDKESNISIYPSDIIADKYRKDFTHVVWYNK